MKLVTQLRFLVLLMLALSLGGATLAVLSFQKASHHIERINLANTAYTNILAVKSHTFQLFKQYGDVLMADGLENSEREAELIAKIRRDIGNIRAAIDAEILLVGEEELEELEDLSRVELKIEELIAGFQRLSKNGDRETMRENWWELSRILDSETDRDFFSMVTDMLAEEEEEVEETRETIARENAYYKSLAIAFAVLALLAALGSVWGVSRNVSRPLRVLLTGVKQLGDGNLSHRIALKGGNEISDIGGTFNMMAEKVSERAESLASANLVLEEAVADRTRQLERLLDDLRQSDANRRRLLADVSHELRTPLTIIKGEADVALRGGEKSPEAYRDALTRARDAASHTARLVDDLLFVARNDTGQLRLSLEALDLKTILEDVIETFGAGASFVTDLDSAPMQGDVGRLRQAVLVLLENARHHGGTQIVLRLNAFPDGYRAAVEDNGPGMPDDEKKHAFERFFRGSNAAERYREGVGLGLPVALSIAEAHGGTIELSDRPSRGLIAALSLPSCSKLEATT